MATDLSRGILVWLAVGALCLAGCGGGSTGTRKGAPEWTLDGWTAFEAGDYAGAVPDFQQAVSADPNYADAYNGLGWSYAKLDRLSDAVTQFSLGRSKGGMSTLVRYEIFAGRAFAYNAQGGLNVAYAIADAETVVTYSPGFSFRLDGEVTAADVRLLLAECYASQGSFVEALAQVQVLAPSFQADVTTAAGRAALLDQVEWLKTQV
jgi:tetratricopeptide (TPR) repeat protein